MAPGRPPLAALGEVGEEILFACVASEADGPLASLRGSLALQRSLRRCFLSLTQGDVSPVSLTRVADRLAARGDGAAGRLAELARLYQRYRALLSASAAKLDTGLARVRRVLSLTHDPRAALGVLRLSATQIDHAEFEIRGLHRLAPWDGLPTLYAVLQACAALFSEPTGHGARLVLPLLTDRDGSERPLLEAALKPILEPIYEQHALRVEIDFQPLGPAVAEEAADTPWGRFVRGLFRPGNAPSLVHADELPVSQLSLTALPSPAAEAQAVARRVRDQLAAGTAPDDLAVIVEDAARRTRVEAALRRYGVPVFRAVETGCFSDGSGRSDLPPPLALPLSLYDLLQQGLPREGLLSVITSSYIRLPLDGDAADASALARALRGAGVRALSGSTRDELSRRIREWLRLQSRKTGQARASRPPDDAPLLEDEPSLPIELQQLSVLLDELASLPTDGTVRHHAQALLRLCERLRLLERASGFQSVSCALSDGDGAEPSEYAARVAQALARDQAAVAVLRRALSELPTRADVLRLGDWRLPRERFATLLRALCLRLWADVARQSSSPAGAVVLGGLFDVPVRSRSLLFFVGLLEGEQPASISEDPLLSDEERQQCNRLLGQALFPLSRHRSEAAPLRWVELLAHGSAAHFSYPRADEEGRPLLPSSFVAAVLHASGRSGPDQVGGATHEPASRIPRPSDARHPSELWLHAAPGFLPVEAVDASVRTLAHALGQRERDRRSRLVSRLGVERSRTAWFSSLAQLDGDPTSQGHILNISADRPQNTGSSGAGPYCGQLSSDRLIAALSARLPGSAKRPLSASALEDYARCPFRFFVYRVLHAAPIEEGSDDLDPLTSGRLHHRVLERFFTELRDQGRLPLRGDESERSLLLRVIDEVLAEFDESERTGHPTLFRARLRRLRSDLLQLIAREATDPLEPGCLPTLLEHPFGPLRIAAEDEAQTESTARTDPSDGALHIAGIIDRIDIGPGRALVLDYKTGQLRRYQDYLRAQLLVTSFQLPLYAAAVQADPAVRALAAAKTTQAVGSGRNESPEPGQPSDAAVQVSARYYAVRQAVVSAALKDEGLFALSGPARTQAGEHNVAEVSYRLWRRLRSGDFRVAPQTCEGCGVEAVCRIGTAAIDRVVIGESSESESTSQVTGSGRSSRASSAVSTGASEDT